MHRLLKTHRTVGLLLSAVVRAIERDKRVRDAAGRGSGSGSVPQVSGDRPGDAVPDADSIPSPARVAADCAETTVITLNFLQSYIEQMRLSE